jgi:hypothetical protein
MMIILETVDTVNPHPPPLSSQTDDLIPNPTQGGTGGPNGRRLSGFRTEPLDASAAAARLRGGGWDGTLWP